MTRRRTSFPIRCWQMLGTAALLVGTAVGLHALITLVVRAVAR